MSRRTCSHGCVRSVSCDPLWDVDQGSWAQGPYAAPTGPCRLHGFGQFPPQCVSAGEHEAVWQPHGQQCAG